MSRPIRVGILGSGFGGTVHAPAYMAHPAFEVVAIASPNSAHHVARERHIPHAFSSLEEMLAGVELDMLSIASPPDEHCSAALTGIERNLHVLCEKPFALTLVEAQLMAQAAAQSERVCGIAHEFRFLPTRQALRELLVNGHLGAPRQIEITQMSPFLRATQLKPRSWWFERAHGGGITGAWLSHVVDMACWLAQRPPIQTVGFGRVANAERIDGQGSFRSTVEDGAYALLDFGEGLIARLCVDGTSVVESFVCGIHGEARTAIASGESIYTERLFTVDDEEQNELEVRALPHASMAAANPLLPTFMALLDAFTARIAGQPSDLASFEDGLRTQEVLEHVGYSPL